MNNLIDGNTRGLGAYCMVCHVAVFGGGDTESQVVSDDPPASHHTYQLALCH